jgi:outer membrane lipoprotein SlyB
MTMSYVFTSCEAEKTLIKRKEVPGGAVGGAVIGGILGNNLGKGAVKVLLVLF